MKATQKIGLHNRFDIEVKDIRTGKVRQKAQAENIILDGLWARLIAAAPSQWARYIHVGTGTGTISAARTALFTYLAYKETDMNWNGVPAHANIGFEPTYMWARYSVQFQPEEQIGQTFSEIGLASGTATNLNTHALLKDMNGNSVTITKTEFDLITIYATVYVQHLDANMVGGNVLVVDDSAQGVMDNLHSALLGLGYHSTSNEWKIGFAAGTPQWKQTAGTFIEIVTPTITYDAVNKKFIAYARLPAGRGNSLNGVGNVILGWWSFTGKTTAMITKEIGAWCSPFPVVGDPIGTGDGNTTDFTTTFPLISGATIKVDGVAVDPADVTIMENKPNSSDMTRYMDIIDYAKNPSRAPTLGVSAYAADADAYIIFRNPYYAEGIDSITHTGYLLTSSDGTTWVALSAATTNNKITTIPAEYKNNQYWKLAAVNSYGATREIVSNAFANYKNVRFDTAPAVGAVITADYNTKVAPKDANHVFDVTFEITLGQYTP